MLILYGDEANGKSVIFQTIVGLLGADNVSNYGVTALINGNEKKKNIANHQREETQLLLGAWCTWVHKRYRYFKRLSASGEPMEARALYGNNFTGIRHTAVYEQYEQVLQWC